MKITVLNSLLLDKPSDELVEKLDELLTYENPAYKSAVMFSPYNTVSLPQYISLLKTIGNSVCIPRGFDVKELPQKLREEYSAATVADLRRPVPAPPFPKRLLSLNKEQIKLVNSVVRAKKSGARRFGTYLVVSSTSTGKTIAQAVIAERLKQRTLVLCKTNLIKTAWYDDLKKLYGIEKKDVGLIQQGQFRIGEHFTLSSLATLARRKPKWDEIFSYFGTVVLDEVHLLPAETIRSFVAACTCMNLVGATATIRKDDDKKRKIVYSHFGPPLIELESVEGATASSMPITGVTEVITNFDYEMSRGEFDYGALIEALIGDDNRNAMIVKQVKQDWDAGHCILITTNRVAHAHLLAEELEQAGVEDVNVLVSELNTGHYYNTLLGMLKAGTVRCIVATDQLISVGANLPPIDRLHVTVPMKDKDKFKQLVGRIRRRSPETGKKDAEITYYLDKHVSYLHNMFKSTGLQVFREMKIPGYENMYQA